VSRLLELEITAIAHGGVFVARHEGRVVFVADAIPGERILAELDEEAGENKRFWRAVTVEVLDASPHRRPHMWPEAGLDRTPADRAGGAELGHIDLAHQRVLKRQVLAESLDRFAGGGLVAPEVVGLDDSDGTGWRTRVTVHADEAGHIGPYAARSHRVIEVGQHPLVRPAIDKKLSLLHAKAPGRYSLIEPGDGKVRVIAPGDSAAAEEVVWEQVGDRRFTLDAGGFWQVHPLAAETLDGVLRDYLAGRVIKDAAHLDLYGGVGLFAATLGELGASRVVTVESSRRATEHAASNLADVPAEAVTARVDRFLSGLSAAEVGRFAGGVVVLDPPRAGAGRAVVAGVHALHPETVVYVACDPVALARDLGTFRDLGWDVAVLRAFDLFPHSHHFETVALLVR
jgi:tRNA/tmRNA/rRNA uracil-C5-methylase (TrmA/RlmC/RlmD family)